MENKKFTVTNDLLAPKEKRFLHLVIDLLTQHIIGLSIAMLIVLISESTNWYMLSDWIDQTDSTEQFFIGLFIFVPYYLLTEIYFSRTIGKYFTKTLVVMKDGSQPNKKTILKRTLCRLIPFEFISFMGEDSQGWHDIFSKTYVVNKRRFYEKKKLYDSFL